MGHNGAIEDSVLHRQTRPILSRGRRHASLSADTIPRGTRFALPDPRDRGHPPLRADEDLTVIRRLASGAYRLYSGKADPRTGKRRNLGTFGSRAAAVRRERQIQFFKRSR